MRYLSAVLFIILLPQFSSATNVGGIIDIDTTWGIEGSPYVIESTVQLGVGIKLTIDPGVTVSDGEIQVWGELCIVGTDNHRINLVNVDIRAEDDNYLPTADIQIQYANITGGCPYWGSGYATISLKDSYVHNTSYMYLRYPASDCTIERNVFAEAGSISVGCSSGTRVYIRNNVFYNMNGVDNWNAMNDSETIVEYNSFYCFGRIVLMLPKGYNSAGIIAQNNFWNTMDTTIIDDMIFDRNDDLECATVIPYQPILSAPHPDTPVFNFNVPPTADAGEDQIVTDNATLNASGSNDSDGTIVSYQWSLQHRTHSTNNASASGEVVEVIGLSQGFYDVTLTVTDNSGLTDTDIIELAALGTLPIENITFQGDADCECTSTSSITFGPRATVERGAKLRLTAPSVKFKSNVTIEDGADFKANQGN